jgi:quercetin dioxygenase-like cupin family protein
MQIENVPFTTIDWSKAPETEHPGISGVARWRTVELGNLRLRLVDYSPGYFADHWCARGHVVLVLEGELTTDLQDGEQRVLAPGQTYCVSNDVAPHRSHTKQGAKLFIVD